LQKEIDAGLNEKVNRTACNNLKYRIANLEKKIARKPRGIPATGRFFDAQSLLSRKMVIFFKKLRMILFEIFEKKG
jgi:hypothetical protein